MFQKKTNIIFDLDGTLTDPKEGITRAAAYALKQFNIQITDTDVLIPFIGPPLMDSFMEFYGFDRDQALQAVVYYREYFSTKGIYENKLYDGIGALLYDLKQNNKRILLATSKPEVFAKQILEHFELSHYFDFIGGSTLDHTRDSKEKVIRYVMDTAAVLPEDAVMIGDRKHDIIGAAACGIQTIGVLYGYGNRIEFVQAGAAGIVSDLKELRAMLL